MRLTGAKKVAAALLVSTSCGCGTLCNLSGKEVWIGPYAPTRGVYPFGGVENDVRWMSRFKDDPLPIGMVVPALDMPLSFVGDILTYPWTALQSLITLQPKDMIPLPEERHACERMPEVVNGQK
jgi:uncharacterized protein YceK